MSAKSSRVRPAGPHTLKGSPHARKSATVILEALTGLRSTQQAADALGVALPRYYVLETRALEGFIAALEPRARGRKRTHEAELRELKAEVYALQRELRRYQALHRTAQRALGVPSQPSTKGGKSSKKAKKKAARRPRKTSRGERVVRVLQTKDAEATNGEGVKA